MTTANDAALLTELSRAADAGPAADHLAETETPLADVLELFARDTISREVLAAFCLQARELKDGEQRHKDVLAVWFPEVEVLVENIQPIPSATESTREIVRRLLAGSEQLVHPSIGEEVFPALRAFKRRVLRLFPQAKRQITHVFHLKDYEDALRAAPLTQILLNWAGIPLEFMPMATRIANILERKGFIPTLQLLQLVSKKDRCIEFWQDQPAEYLVWPWEPGRQVGDTIDFGINWEGTHEYGILLSRPDRDGRMRCRFPDGATRIIWQR